MSTHTCEAITLSPSRFELVLDWAAREAEMAGQPSSAEQRKSFDPLASIHMLRTDLHENGCVLPETRSRIRDEELSLLAEGVERAARTSFVLGRGDDGELIYAKNGKPASYIGMLLTGRDVARAEAVADPRKQFLAEDAVNDLAYGYAMQALRPGEQLVWASPYREDIEQVYGAGFMRSCGRFPERKMGFLYRAYACESGEVVLESQTIDNSHVHGVEQALAQGRAFGNMDDMVAQYDRVLQHEQGGVWYAGRKDTARYENAWNMLRAHQDLTDYLLTGLELIAARPLYGEALELVAKRHLYGVWAAFKRRLDGAASAPAPAGLHWPGMRPVSGIVQTPVVYHYVIEQEVRRAYAQYASEGRVMVGCGGAISVRTEDSIVSSDSTDVFTDIFSGSTGSKQNEPEDCEFISKECPNCHKKNVKTVCRNGRYEGACGCKS